MGRYDDTNDGGIHLPDIVEQPCGLHAGLEAFSSDYDADDYRDWVEQSNGDPVPAPIVLYLQDGAANGFGQDALSVDQLNQARAIERELRAQGALFDADRPLQQMILTGSIATQWSENQLYRLVSTLQSSFLVNSDSLNSWCACVGVAIPTEERLRLLRVLGFNHLRFTLVDSVQAVPLAESLAAAIRQAKQLGFDRIILDVRQMPADATLVNILESLAHQAKPDRIRMPHPGNEGSDTFDQALLTMGFRNIGLDWYLREDDSWWQARERDGLYWILLGYSELRNPDVIGVGPGALSSVGDCYSLNETSLPNYVAMVEQGGLPIVRGAELESANLLRREIIAMILTTSRIHVSRLEEKWGIQFDQFFARENELLQALFGNRPVVRKTNFIEFNARDHRKLVEICRIFQGGPSHGSAAAAYLPSSKSAPVSKSHLVS